VSRFFLPSMWDPTSPNLVAVYIDGVVKKVIDSKIGCYIKRIFMSILLYADDRPIASLALMVLIM